MTMLNQSHHFLLMAYNKKEIVFLYNPMHFGSTLLRPTYKVGCLVGIGSKAIPVTVNNRAALLSLHMVVPPKSDIHCTTINKLRAFPTPPTIGGIANLEGLHTFFPAPSLCNAILTEDSISPLAYVLTGRNSGKEHICLHSDNEDFDEDDVNNHIKIFTLWCLGVHQGQVNKTCFSVDPNNGELKSYCACLHRKNIMPSLTSASAMQTSTAKHVRHPQDTCCWHHLHPQRGQESKQNST